MRLELANKFHSHLDIVGNAVCFLLTGRSAPKGTQIYEIPQMYAVMRFPSFVEI
jgi:hypothetical protein